MSDVIIYTHPDFNGGLLNQTTTEGGAWMNRIWKWRKFLIVRVEWQHVEDVDEGLLA